VSVTPVVRVAAVECLCRREAVASNSHATLVDVPSLPRGVSLLLPLCLLVIRPRMCHMLYLGRRCQSSSTLQLALWLSCVGLGITAFNAGAPFTANHASSLCPLSRCRVVKSVDPRPRIVACVVLRWSSLASVGSPARAVAILRGLCHHLFQRWCTLMGGPRTATVNLAVAACSAGVPLWVSCVLRRLLKSLLANQCELAVSSSPRAPRCGPGVEIYIYIF
jgi:hypothetical protein